MSEQERRVRRLWTPQDDAELRKHWGDGLSCQKIGAIMDRAHGSVNMRAHKLGLPARFGGSGRTPLIPKQPKLPKILTVPNRANVVIKMYWDAWSQRVIPVSLPRIPFIDGPAPQ